MKAILKSIKPYWLYLILTEKKTVELNKNRPTSDDWNECVYLYCSKDLSPFKRIPVEHQAWMNNYLGRVSCSFWCGRIEEFHQFMLEPRNHYERENLDTDDEDYYEAYNCGSFKPKDIGKIVFLTREEAERALKEGAE